MHKPDRKSMSGKTWLVDFKIGKNQQKKPLNLFDGQATYTDTCQAPGPS